MKIQIDTDKKVLRLESDVNLQELMTKVKVLFPDGEWKEYTLETNVEIKWQNPIYIDRWHYPTYPWWNPHTITYDVGDTTPLSRTITNARSDEWVNVELEHHGARMDSLLADTGGVYNVEI